MKKFNFLIFVLILVTYFLISLPYYSGDVKNHLVWANSLLSEGVRGFYLRYFHDFAFQSYPPLAMLFFVISLGLYEIINRLIHNLNLIFSFFPSQSVYFIEDFNTKIAFLKLPALISTVLTGALMVYYKDLLKSKLKNWQVILLFLLNPAFIYLSAVWGQIDFMQSFFILLAFYFLFKEKYILSVVLAVLAILSKQNILVLYLAYFLILFRKVGFKKTFLFGVLNVLIFYLSFIPFNQTSLVWPFSFYLYTLDITGYLTSDNAINFWGFLFSYLPGDARDVEFFISWEWWGHLTFGLLLLIAYLILLSKKVTPKNIILFIFLVSLSYFFFLTKMHERYLLPAVIISFMVFLINKKYVFNYLFFSFFLFVNLYKGIKEPDMVLFNYLAFTNSALNSLVLIYAILLGLNFYLFSKERDD